MTFEQWVLELWYFTWILPVIRPFCGYHYFWHCDLDLEVSPIFFDTFHLAYNFWTVSARAFIFHMSIPFDKTFPWFYYFLSNIRAFILHMTFLVTRSFYWYQDFVYVITVIYIVQCIRFMDRKPKLRPNVMYMQCIYQAEWIVVCFHKKKLSQQILLLT